MGIIYNRRIYQLLIIFITVFSINVNAKKCSYEEEIKIEKEVNKYLNLLKCNFNINYMTETDEILQKCIELESECEKEATYFTSDGKRWKEKYTFSSCYESVYLLCVKARSNAYIKARERCKNYKCETDEKCEPLLNTIDKRYDFMEKFCNLYSDDSEDNIKKDACRAELNKGEVKYLNSLCK